MKISKAEEQSLRIAVRMAEAGGQLTLADLSASEHLPEATIAKLLGRLRRGGLVTALRGRNGGYVLSRPGREINVADVIRALGRPVLEGSNCSPEVPNDQQCPHAGDCALRSVWRHLRDQIVHVLERTTLVDLTHTERDVRRQMTELAAGSPLVAFEDSTRELNRS